MKRTLAVIIPCSLLFAQLVSAQQVQVLPQQNQTLIQQPVQYFSSNTEETEVSAQTETASASNLQNADVSIAFYDKTIYYPDSAIDNPIYVRITISNTGTETLRFKLADDRKFSLDFSVYTVKNRELPQTDALVQRRTTSATVYFREIALESGEEYSFTENLKDYIAIDTPAVYYVDLALYPELYKSRDISLVSNRLTLEVRPSPSAASSAVLPVAADTVAVLQPQDIAPDKVVEQTLIARQKGLWDQFFLYIDLEQMLMRDPGRGQKYRIASARERQRMLEQYKADLMQERMDNDIVSIPDSFEIERTVYSQAEGTVSVIEWFQYNNFRERKRYTYDVHLRDGIWLIYNYTVENLGTE